MRRVVDGGLRRDLAVAAAALATGLGLFTLSRLALFGDGVLSPWVLPPLVLVCAGLVFRRSAPLLALLIGTTAVAADIVIGPSLATPLIYTQILYDATLYHSRRTARALVWASVATTLAATAAGLIWLPNGYGLQVGFLVGLLTILPVITALEVRHHREQADAERIRAEQVARLAELDHRGAVAAERTRMARELHDLVANHLSAIAVQSAAALAISDPQRQQVDAGATRRALEVIRENSVQGLDEMRQMIEVLRDGDQSDPPTTAPRLDEVKPLLDHAAEAGLPVELRVRGEARRLPAAVELAAYRIVQESLTNALKHATPARADVSIDYHPDRVEITVENTLPRQLNGVGVPGSGTGLIGMSERAALLDGVFSAGPHDGRWRVRVELPTAEQAP